ncbi:MAG: hypothetical protein K8T89_15590 [Planctomycetes bacterium]|nr:hypothetical protein [Planctomycetota bacterium]
MYHAFALMTPECTLTIPDVASKLKARFPTLDVAVDGNEIILSTPTWDYHLELQSSPDVLNESEGFAGRIAGLDEDTPMRKCNRRLEVWSDTPDITMEHFDDHFQILDVLRGFKGVILVDPKEPAIL